MLKYLLTLCANDFPEFRLTDRLNEEVIAIGSNVGFDVDKENVPKLIDCQLGN